MAHVKGQVRGAATWLDGDPKPSDAGHRATVRSAQWVWSRIVATRDACESVGGIEYLVWWEGGDTTWEGKVHLQEGADDRLRRAMVAAEGKRRPCSLHELLKQSEGKSGPLGSMARAAQRAVQGNGSDEDEWKMILMLRYHAARMGTARRASEHEMCVASQNHALQVEAQGHDGGEVMR